MLRNFEQNGLEFNEIFFLDSSSSFEHEQIGFCGILENYFSFFFFFCTRKRVCN